MPRSRCPTGVEVAKCEREGRRERPVRRFAEDGAVGFLGRYIDLATFAFQVLAKVI